MAGARRDNDENETKEWSNFRNGLVKARVSTFDDACRRFGQGDRNVELMVSVAQQAYGVDEKEYVDVKLVFFSDRAKTVWDNFGPGGVFHGKKNVDVYFPADGLIFNHFDGKLKDGVVTVEEDEYDTADYDIIGPRFNLTFKPWFILFDVANNLVESIEYTTEYDLRYGNKGDGNGERKTSTRSGGRSGSSSRSRTKSSSRKKDEDQGSEETTDSGDEAPEDSGEAEGESEGKPERTTSRRAGRSNSRTRGRR